MAFLTDLWLPILVSAVFIFIASSVIHMALPIHKGDFRKMPNEDAVLQAMRANGVEPGAYMFPCAGSMKDMGSPEMLEKVRQGPVGWLTVGPPGAFNISRSLVQWFVYSLVVSALVAYVGWHSLGPGAWFGNVFRITGAAAVLCYGVGHIPDSIWKGVSWGTTLKFVIDGVIYALVTGAAFGWLWPKTA